MFLITGYMRSGTKYIANLLSKYIKVEHEIINSGNLGIVSWAHIRSGVCKSLPAAVVQNKKYNPVLHQTRDPLKVISSASYNRSVDNDTFKFMFQYIGTPSKQTTLLNTMYCYLHWNLLIEKEAQYRYQIENIENEIVNIGNLLGINKKIEIISDKNINTRGTYKKYTWDDLFNENEQIASELKIMSERYGYK